ncbi:Serine/threonine-protein kinase pelle [Halotydeus destructor]|nr:Serine/threonine-protein kinase pelle [Halotydeus destructor]
MDLSLNSAHYNSGVSNMSLPSRSGSSLIQCNYIYDLPYSARKSLCDLLDADGSWRQLGGEYMSLTDTQLTLISHALFRGASPTNDLLVKWEQSNPKVSSLFKFLAAMKHIRALLILKPFVHPQLAALCDDEMFTSNDFVSKVSDSKARSTSNVQYVHTSEQNLSSLGAVGGRPPVSPDTLKGSHPSYYNLKVNIPDTPKQLSPDTNQESKVLNQEPSEWHMNNFSQPASTILNLPRSRGTQEGRTEDTVPVTIPRSGSVLSRQSEMSQMDDDLEVMYKEMLIATDEFSKDRIIGSGGFGVVYRGEWKGTQVAIKRLKGVENVSQAITELRVLNRYRIDNILPLYGISLDGPEACVLYQFMPNGSLEDKLLDKDKSGIILSWNQRASIGEGIARALNYLHTLKGKALVHGDVKAANVLLDSQFEPKLGDFGLSRPVSSLNGGDSARGMYTHITVTSVHGTSVYLPPEYLRQKILSPAVDVYSYGIVMLEMATGRRAFDGRKLLIDLVDDEVQAGKTDVTRDGGIKLRDAKIADHPDAALWCTSLIKLGLDCAHRLKRKRPHMGMVLDFYSQCRTRDRIRRLSMESGRSPPTSSTLHSHFPPNLHLRTPMEIQLWYDMARTAAASTMCPTIGSNSVHDVANMSAVATEERIISFPVPDLRRQDVAPREHFPQVPEGDQSNRESGDLVNQENGDDVDVVIPLITELGISMKVENDGKQVGDEEVHDVHGTLSDLSSSHFSRMSTPPSE